MISGNCVESQEERNVNNGVSRVSILFIPPWHGVNFKLLDTPEDSESTKLDIPHTDAAVILGSMHLSRISISNSDIALGRFVQVLKGLGTLF